MREIVALQTAALQDRFDERESFRRAIAHGNRNCPV
jgi:hypothetical protein